MEEENKFEPRNLFHSGAFAKLFQRGEEYFYTCCGGVEGPFKTPDDAEEWLDAETDNWFFEFRLIIADEDIIDACLLSDRVGALTWWRGLSDVERDTINRKYFNESAFPDTAAYASLITTMWNKEHGTVPVGTKF